MYVSRSTSEGTMLVGEGVPARDLLGEIRADFEVADGFFQASLAKTRSVISPMLIRIR